MVVVLAFLQLFDAICIDIQQHKIHVHILTLDKCLFITESFCPTHRNDKHPLCRKKIYIYETI